MQNLQGKVALITGAARRLGATTARYLHQQGASVVIHYRSSSTEAKLLANELNAIRPESCYLQQAELSNTSEIEVMIAATIKQTGRLDILINNASSFYPTPLGKITGEDWDNLMGSNLKAPLFLSQAAASELQKNKGCIVNMVDIHAIRPLADHPVYSAAKAGLMMLTKALANDMGPNVRVNAIAPGAILWPEADANIQGMDEEHQLLLNKTALKRVGAPDDIARAILFLVQNADYITGHTIPVDGGRMLNQ